MVRTMVRTMVRKRAAGAVALAGLAAAVLSLAACQALFVGVFPAAASQLSARADLSAAVSSSAASSFGLDTVTVGGSEYVVLASMSGFDPAQPHILVMDAHLKTVSTFTNADVLVTTGSYLSGQYVMADVNGDVVVGNVRLALSASGFVIVGPAVHALSQPAVIGLGVNEADFGASGNFFTYTEYDDAWGAPLPSSTFLGAPSTTLNFQGAFTDPDSLSGPDVFVLQDYGSQVVWILTIPKLQINGATLSSFTSNVFSDYKPYSLTDLDSSTVSYARGSVIAFNHRSDDLVRFPLDDPNRTSLLPLAYSDHLGVAAGPSGTWCVVWNPDARELARYEQWW